MQKSESVREGHVVHTSHFYLRLLKIFFGDSAVLHNIITLHLAFCELTQMALFDFLGMQIFRLITIAIKWAQFG